jgi:hypothetical protein
VGAFGERRRTLSNVFSLTNGRLNHGVPEAAMFSTGFLTPGAQSVHEASGVSGSRLPGLLISLASRAICDMKNLKGASTTLWSPGRLVVGLGSKLRPFTIGFSLFASTTILYTGNCLTEHA